MLDVTEEESTSRTWFAKVPKPQFKQTNKQHNLKKTFRIVFNPFLMMFDVAEEEPTSRTWFHA